MSAPRRGRGKPRPGQAAEAGVASPPSSPLEDPLVVLQASLPPGISPYHLQCPLCREMLNDPRDLPCGHSSCFLCLGNTVGSNTMPRLSRHTYGMLNRTMKLIAQLGGLGAFALPMSRLATLVVQLRTDGRFLRAIRSLPPLQVAAPLAMLPSMAAGVSIYDAPAAPFAVSMQPSAPISSGDKYADFRALLDSPQPLVQHSPSADPYQPGSTSFSFLNPVANPPIIPSAQHAPSIYDPMPQPMMASPIKTQPMVMMPSTVVLTPTPSPISVPSPVPLKPSPSPVYVTPAPTPTPVHHYPVTAPVAATPPTAHPTSAPVSIAPRSELVAVPPPASTVATPTPAPSSPAPEGSFFARAAAMFGSLSVAETPVPVAAAPARPPDGKSIAAPPARPHPPELLAALKEAEKYSSSPVSQAAPAHTVVHDNFMASQPPLTAQGQDFAPLDSDDMFAGMTPGAGMMGAAPPSPTPTALKEPLSRAEYARQKREALKKKKYDEAEQNATIKKREQELEQQQRWEMQRAVESQSSAVMQSKLAELQEKTKRENTEREARLKRQKELREEHRKTLLATDPAAAPGGNTSSIPDINSALNYAEFAVRTEDLRNLFNAWARNLWFAPDDILAKAIFGPIQPAYCPFFLFEAKTTSQYTGQMCKATEQVTPQGERKMVDTWLPVTGTYKGAYSNVLVCAAVGDDAKYLCSLKNWDVNKVYYEGDNGPRPANASSDTFASKFFKAVVDSIPKVRPLRDQLLPAEAWQIVWHEYEETFVRPNEERQASAKVLAEERGKGVSGMKLATTYDVTRKLIYFPVYICAFVYDNKSYRFVVHGQNSSVEADRPYGLGMVGSTAKQGLEAITNLFKK